MKYQRPHLAALFAVLLLPTLCNGQVWAPVGAEWTYQATTGQWPWTDTYWDHHVAVVGDTVIDGRPCSVLECPLSDAWPCFPLFTATVDVYMTLANDSLLFRTAQDSTFKLLMDFQATAGDTWDIPMAFTEDGGNTVHDTITYVVTSTDTLWYNGLPLRRIHYHTSTQFTLFLNFQEGVFVERIGEMHYLFPWYSPWVSDGMGFTGLKCYTDPLFNWPSPGVPCDIWLGGAAFTAGPFTIRPTVAAAGALFTVEAVSGTGQLMIHDALGRPFSTVAVGSGPTTFTLPAAGVYFARYTVAEGTIRTQRIVVY
ncbi:MAG: T9SS type A sorting domain-containing protein [Flavobacteriales bacterium]|nr:T9SS type A sorting domain-containing protein [Flavobacteriales bacterium]MBP9081371.1 T9SS type A sorting domain-containing protein [Flavobacteriales bacterium]